MFELYFQEFGDEWEKVGEKFSFYNRTTKPGVAPERELRCNFWLRPLQSSVSQSNNSTITATQPSNTPLTSLEAPDSNVPTTPELQARLRNLLENKNDKPILPNAILSDSESQNVTFFCFYTFVFPSFLRFCVIQVKC